MQLKIKYYNNFNSPKREKKLLKVKFLMKNSSNHKSKKISTNKGSLMILASKKKNLD
jgi:hypothetical protein